MSDQSLAQTAAPRLVLRRELIERYGITVASTTLWRWERSGKFPKRVHLSERVIAWPAAEVEAWIAQKGIKA